MCGMEVKKVLHLRINTKQPGVVPGCFVIEQVVVIVF